MAFKLLTFFLVGMSLFKDSRKDKGEHRAAKIIQALCLALIVLSYSSAFARVVWLVGNWGPAQTKFMVPVGPVTAQIHFLFFLIHCALGPVVLILAYMLSSRKEVARQTFLYVIPILFLLESFNFYRSWVSGEPAEAAYSFYPFLYGMIFFGIPSTGLFLIYSSRMMINYFKSPEQDEVSYEEVSPGTDPHVDQPDSMEHADENPLPGSDS
jgi:hypothetical protein